MGSTEKNVGKGMTTCALGKSLWLQWVGQLEDGGQKRGKKQRGKIQRRQETSDEAAATVLQRSQEMKVA